jgi:hypothetical protein
MGDVFISYSRRDSEFVEGLAANLEARGKRVWIDTATLDYAGVIRVWDACTYCQNPTALLALAQTRVTRQLTPAERRTFSWPPRLMSAALRGLTAPVYGVPTLLRPIAEEGLEPPTRGL